MEEPGLPVVSWDNDIVTGFYRCKKSCRHILQDFFLPLVFILLYYWFVDDLIRGSQACTGSDPPVD